MKKITVHSLHIQSDDVRIHLALDIAKKLNGNHPVISIKSQKQAVHMVNNDFIKALAFLTETCD